MAGTSAQLFQLGEYDVVRSPVVGRPNLLPHNGTIGVNDKDGRVDIPSLVVHLVSPGDVSAGVVEHGERVLSRPGCQVRTGEVINGDRDYLGVQIGEFVVIPLQLPELLNAVASPESSIEDQNNVPLVAIGIETDFRALCAGQRELAGKVGWRFRGRRFR